MTLISIKSAPVLSTSGKKTGKKLVRAISAESMYRCMLLFLDHILYRRAHFVRARYKYEALTYNLVAMLFGDKMWLYGQKGRHHITKTCLYNFDPLKPYFYIVKLGFTGVYIIFLFLLQNIDCVYSLEPPHRTHNLCFEQKFEKYQRFLSEIFQFLKVKFSTYLHRHVFVMKR